MDMTHGSAMRRGTAGAEGLLFIKRHLRALAGCSACSFAVVAAVVILQTPVVQEFCSNRAKAIYVEFAAQLDQMESSMGRPRV